MYFLFYLRENFIYTQTLLIMALVVILYQIVDAKERPAFISKSLTLLNLNGLSFKRSSMLFCIHKQLESLT
jgi:hypothetical protein